ncbi:MAG TPA: DNA polymerase III subunit beta [bacterium]|nr:DNA polymerase III subunit beta [bacterium]
MHLKCSQDHLLRAVQTVGRAISPRASMPILGNVLVETTKNGAKLIATDLELGIEAYVTGTVKEGGAVTLPARILTDIVTNLPEAPVEIAVAEGESKALITSENVRFEILGLPATDFPLMPAGEGNIVVKFDAGLLRTMIRQTSFAVSTDETRPFLTGVYLVVDGDQGHLVATDGGRLAVRRAKMGTGGHGKVAAIVPSKTMAELVRVLGSVEGEVSIASHDNQLIFSLPGMRFVSRLIAGQFPNYEQVIPKEFKQRITVGTERLLRGVRRASITAKDSANVVRLNASEGMLTISSNTPDVGKAQEDIEVRVEGDAIPVAFNAKFLMDALSNIDAPDVHFDLTGPLSPGALHPTDNSEYVYVLAPVRVYS